MISDPVWIPTPADVKALGLPDFDDLASDHISDQTERDKLTKAIATVRRFVVEMRDRPGLSLILSAGALADDPLRTGFGCGKTTLAKIVYAKNGELRYAPSDPDSLTVVFRGRYMEAREAMDIFAEGVFQPRETFRNFSNLIVLDDVGREGAIKYEKRDPDSQTAEKQARYYNIIDWCCERRISLVLTSNMAASALAQFLGGASWSRLLQMAPKRYRINLTGVQDYRAQSSYRHRAL